MGDSGGDGPHFEWAHRTGAFIIGSMTKPSLAGYCGQRGIAMNRQFGLVYGPGEPRDPGREMAVDFQDLTAFIEKVLAS
jgi:hypothetical protein